jgi:hypothetical protein
VNKSYTADAQRLFIRDRCSTGPFTPARVSDFQYESGPAIDPATALLHPDFSLYCFDHARQRVLLLEMPPGSLLEREPFLYAAQRRYAIGAVTVSYAAFHRVADSLSLEDDRIVVIHSVGRCGSTLVTKAFGCVPDVRTISEPDVLTQLTAMRHPKDEDHPGIRRLLGSAIRVLCKPSIQDPPRRHWVIKPRMPAIDLADLICREFPRAQNLFVYRKGFAWLASVFAAFHYDDSQQELGGDSKMEEFFESMNPLVFEYRQEPQAQSPARLWTLSWIRCMERYLELQAASTSFRAVRFEDLQLDPAAVIGELLSLHGIERPEETSLAAVLAADSQAGSGIERAKTRGRHSQLPDRWRQEAASLIAGRTRLSGPDMLLPATLCTLRPPVATAGASSEL